MEHFKFTFGAEQSPGVYDISTSERSLVGESRSLPYFNLWDRSFETGDMSTKAARGQCLTLFPLIPLVIDS